MNSIITLSPSITAGPTGLTFHNGISFDEWQEVGKKLKAVRGTIHWWIGDWLNYGEGRWGEMYSQALEETPYVYQTLANDKFVASRFEFYRRRENLSWSHHEAVASLETEEQEKLLDVAESLNLNRDDFRKEVAKYKGRPHVSFNTGESEWYTPPEYIESAVRVMGQIDLDPASSEVANEIVKATRFYTVEDNGLNKHWGGRVWLNPPYSIELIRLFIAKYIEHILSGDITEGIVLVNNATETNWFSGLVGVSSAIVFPAGRVKFLDPQGNPGAPLQGQAILYFGNHPDLFIQEYSKFGWSAILK